MIEDMGFKRTNVEWRVAWDSPPKAKPARNNNPNQAGQTDDRDETIRKLQEKIDRLEKRLDEADKKSSSNRRSMTVPSSLAVADRFSFQNRCFDRLGCKDWLTLLFRGLR